MPLSIRWSFRKSDDAIVESDRRTGRPLRQAISNSFSPQSTRSPLSPDSYAFETDADANEDAPYGIKVLVARPGDRHGYLDIVAIHGLNGHREKTWTDRTTGLNWLSNDQCLPKDIPHARVLSFGYNSKTYFSRSNSDVREFASDLLAEIQASRRTEFERQRPMIFLCHSLGGLVFKQAVIRAHERCSFYDNVLSNIRGVVFFGTPHRGSDLAFWNRIGTSLLQIGTFGYLSNPTLSKDLMIDAEMLRNISDSFACRAGDFSIRSFYETQLMPGLNCRVVERDSSVMGLANELDIASPAHHSSICKFPTPSDTRYRTAISVVADLAQYSEDNEQDYREFTSLEQACMRELYSDYEHHLAQVDDPIAGTCTWLLTQNAWLRWENLEGPGLLWITADAGCGKSVTAKFLVNHIQSQQKEPRERYICYFFFKEGLDGQDNAAAAVSALLHQLCLVRRRLILHVLAKYTSMPTKAFNRFSTLWSILLNIIQDSSREVVWIVDGLDECDSRSRDELIKSLNSYLKSARHGGGGGGGRLNVILLSRPHNSIHQKLQLNMDEKAEESTAPLGEKSHGNKMRLAVEEESEAVSRDIALFVSSKLEGLGQQKLLSTKVLASLERCLIQGADFTFLWISLVVQLIEDAGIDGISIKELEALLNAANLDDVYERLLAKRTHPLKTRKVLSMVLAAVRPLTLDEMCAALEVRQDHGMEMEEARNSLAPLGKAPCSEFLETKKKISSGQGNATTTTTTTTTTKSGVAEMMDARNQETRNKGRDGVKSEPDHAKHPSRLKIRLAGSGLEELGKLLHRPFENHLRQLCGHFIRIRAKRIYLVHQTARKFLLDTGRGDSVVDWKKSPPSQRKWRHSIRLVDGHRCLALTCRDYMDLFKFEFASRQILWIGRPVSEYLKDCLEDPPRAFFKYTAFHWVDHYRPFRKALDFSLDHLLRPSNWHFKLWILVHRNWMPEEERMRLETGGIAIPMDPSGSLLDNKGDYLFYYQSHESMHSDMKGSNKDVEAFQSVLDFFDLGLDKETEEYDREFLDGDRYWKGPEHEPDEGEEVNDESEYGQGQNGEKGGLVHLAGKLPERVPDKVQYFRGQHRRTYLYNQAELCNPMSPTGGNPDSRSSFISRD